MQVISLVTSSEQSSKSLCSHHDGLLWSTIYGQVLQHIEGDQNHQIHSVRNSTLYNDLPSRTTIIPNLDNMAPIERHVDKLKDKTVLLIAGTGGLGLAVASACLSRGAKVILTSTRQSKLTEKIEELRKLYNDVEPASVIGYTLNLGTPDVEDNIKTFFQQMQQDGIGITHHVVYLAGDPLPTASIDEIELDFWMRASQVRTIAALLLIKHVLPFLRAAGPATPVCSPSITLTGGSVGDKPIPGGWTILAMIGASIQGGARQLALDLKPLRVNAVAPGPVDTDLWNVMDEQTRKEFYKGIEEKVPTGRVGHVMDVAESYIYAMVDGNLTGEVLRTNSGTLLV